jgi:uncharacterized protein with HEPN domain
MNAADRISGYLDDLEIALRNAAELADRGREAYDDDIALRLAFEALSSRVGEIAKRLVATDAARFSERVWSLAAGQRDFTVHHYNRIDYDLLWQTVAVDFPALHDLAAGKR